MPTLTLLPAQMSVVRNGLLHRSVKLARDHAAARELLGERKARRWRLMLNRSERLRERIIDTGYGEG